MDDLDLLSSDQLYFVSIQSNDSKYHDVNLYIEGSTAWALNEYSLSALQNLLEK